MEPLEPTPEAERNTVAPEQVEAAVSVATRIADNIRRLDRGLSLARTVR